MIPIKGRDIFLKHKKVIGFLFVIFKLFPNFLIVILLRIIDASESKGALLLRYFYLKKNIPVCGVNIFIGKYVTFKNIDNLSLGSNISIHAYCYIDSAGGISIDDNVSVANHTSIISFEHTWSDVNIPIKYNGVTKSKVSIGQDVWIGNGCRILAGVNIDSRSIVAAGAVVNKNVEKNSIVGGVPAKVIKEI